jgi:hypothetical protein
LKRAGPDSSFARAWADAQVSGETNAYYTTIGRAITGVETPYFYRGVQRGTRRVYDNRLLIAAFQAAERAKARRKARKKARKRAQASERAQARAATLPDLLAECLPFTAL